MKGYCFSVEGIQKGYHLSMEGIQKGYNNNNNNNNNNNDNDNDNNNNNNNDNNNNKTYIAPISFLPKKTVYKRVSGRTSRRSLPVSIFFSTSPSPPGQYERS